MRKEYRRNLIKFSNYSLCVTLPKTMLKKMELDKGDEVMITMKRGKIILEPASNTGPEVKSTKSGKKSDNWEPLPELSRDQE